VDLRSRILLLFGVAAILVGMVTAVPATASSASSSVQPQHLGKAKLIGHSTVTASATNLVEGNTATGAPAAFTDDPALIRSTLGGGPLSGGFPRNAASKVLSGASQQSGNENQGAATSIKGLNAHDLAATHGFVAEPPDQGLCANSKYVIEMVNLNLKIFNSNLEALSGPIVLETFFGDNLAFGAAGGDLTVQGDPRCIWDAGSGRWYLSQLLVDFTNSTSVFQVAVSTSSNPLGEYNLYSLDNTDSSNPNCPCLGDQPTMGANPDALFISTNEFGINNGFNGAVVYTIDKGALADGESTANVVADFVGLTFPTPEWHDNVNCITTQGLFCWATLRPSTSPTSGERRFGGVEYLLSALDFANVNDNRIAVWAVTNTRSIRSENPKLGLSEKTMVSEPYIFPAFARQKAGPIPLGDSGRYSCEPHNPCPHPTPQAEGMIQTNDDQFGSAVYAAGLVWGGLTTTMPDNSGQIGIAYFAVKPRLNDHGLGGSSIALQGYLTAEGNDVEFPSIAVTSSGHGLISFTLSGPNYFPTSAYAMIDSKGVSKVKVAALGQSPQDGFTEFEFKNGGPGAGQYRPRWGDYSAVVAVGQTFVFASEYIQFPNCSDEVFKKDTTCGGTRSRAANWGTSVNKVSVSDEEGNH
jgi:hypothetical protein